MALKAPAPDSMALKAPAADARARGRLAFTDGALAACAGAVAAFQRGGVVGTEHLLWALVHAAAARGGAPAPRGVAWLAGAAGMLLPEAALRVGAALAALPSASGGRAPDAAVFLDALAGGTLPRACVAPFVSAGEETAGDGAALPQLSPSLVRVLLLAGTLSTPIITEALVVAMLYTDCLGAQAIGTACRLTGTDALALPCGWRAPEVLARAAVAASAGLQWTVLEARPGVPLEPAFPPCGLAGLATPLPPAAPAPGPLPFVATLVRDARGAPRVLMGPYPGELMWGMAYLSLLRSLVTAGAGRVTVFVNLTEESDAELAAGYVSELRDVLCAADGAVSRGTAGGAGLGSPRRVQHSCSEPPRAPPRRGPPATSRCCTSASWTLGRRRRRS